MFKIGDVKFRVGRMLIPGTIEKENNRLFLKFPFNKNLLSEVKVMSGAKWHGYDELNPKKVWSVTDSLRNRFQLDYLTGGDPYQWYDKPLIETKSNRPNIYKHQLEIKSHILTRRHCISGDCFVNIRYEGCNAKITLRELYNNYTRAWRLKNVEIMGSDDRGERSEVGKGVRWNKLVNVINIGQKNVTKIILSNNRIIWATEDHEIAVAYQEYKKVEDLRVHDFVLCNYYGDICRVEIGDIFRDDEEIDVYDVSCVPPYHNFLANGILVHNCIVATEMGGGKTLATIEALEELNYNSIWVGPKSALIAVQLEFAKWKAKVWPEFISYDELKKQNFTNTPRAVIFDEAHNIKNPTSQRSQAALALANAIRSEYNYDSLIVLLTGSPAPKDPSDFWHLSEVACPGFLREGDIRKFKQRLALIEQRETDYGSYPHLITWKDSEKKCNKCGLPFDAAEHDSINMVESWFHPFTPGVNEVGLLYKRMNGLVDVKFKKDLLDLPEKVFRTWICKPNDSVLRAAEIIDAKAKTAIEALTLRRELSDGFQYQQIESGTESCKVCFGSGEEIEYYDEAEPSYTLEPEEVVTCQRNIYNNNQEIIDRKSFNRLQRMSECSSCHGKKYVPKFARKAVQVECPKDDALINLLEMYEEEGRSIVWAAFTASVDRCVKTVMKAGWKTIRIDGRGWHSFDFPNCDALELNRIFDNRESADKIAIVGNPAAGGQGLNLTASSNLIYFSNTFKGVDRIQSIDRIHRPGADFNRGCTIWDIIHLPSDLYVLNNLNKKRDLQAMSLGDMKAELSSINVSAGDIRTI